MARFIPGPPGLLSLFCQIFILEERTALYPLFADILIQIRPNAAFSGIDLQTAEDGQRFNFPAVPLPFFRVGILTVCNNTAVHSGVADLADAGGEGVFYRAEFLPPVICVGQRR